MQRNLFMQIAFSQEKLILHLLNIRIWFPLWDWCKMREAMCVRIHREPINSLERWHFSFEISINFVVSQVRFVCSCCFGQIHTLWFFCAQKSSWTPDRKEQQKRGDRIKFKAEALINSGCGLFLLKFLTLPWATYWISLSNHAKLGLILRLIPDVWSPCRAWWGKDSLTSSPVTLLAGSQEPKLGQLGSMQGGSGTSWYLLSVLCHLWKCNRANLQVPAEQKGFCTVGFLFWGEKVYCRSWCVETLLHHSRLINPTLGQKLVNTR